MNFIIFTILLLLFKEGYGAADFDVERVQSPYVESRDVGPMMQSESTSQHISPSFQSYSTFNTPNRGCLSCQHGMGGSGSSSSSSYSSFSSYGGGMRASPIYAAPRQSSSRHEFKKEQEFVNGQQVYDLHHEKKYKDGQLIDESRHEKTPDDFGIRNTGRSQSASLYGPHNSAYGSSKSFAESQRSSSSYHTAPQTSYQTGQYHESQNSGFRPDNDFEDDDFDDEFEREMERMREELRRKTLATSHHQQISSPAYGGSHRSEYHKETRYVNGKPVYMFNEEKKYKDGKLIHNVRDEKGPDDLGATGAFPTSPILTSPTGKAYSSHHQEVYKSQSQPPVSGPSSRYPSYQPSYPSPFINTDDRTHNPASYSSSSESSSSYYHQQPYYRPSTVYTSQSVGEQKETQTHRSYYPTHDRSGENEIDGNYPYSDSRAPRVDSYYRPETTTPVTVTNRPLYESRPNYSQKSVSQHQYEQSSSSKQYSQDRPVSAPVTYNHLSQEQTYGSEEKIREASQSSYYDLKSRQDYGEDDDRPRYQHLSDRTEVIDQDELPSYNTGVFSTYSESRESKTSHASPTRTGTVTDTSRSYRPNTHSTTSSQEDFSRRVSSGYYPSREHRPEDSSSPDLNIPGVIPGPSGHHETSKENEIEDEEERYDISPYDGVSDTRPREESTPNPVQYERYPTGQTGYSPRRYPEPDRYIGQNQRGYSIYNSSRIDHIRKVLPSRWVETKTTWKYRNGKLASETKHYRYYENGILIHENSTRRTRDELKSDGIDVNALDLTASQLIEYGPALSSTSHSQKHEMHQIKRFKNGQQIYELNHERRFQDGNLVQDKRDEKDEDDFESIPYTANAYNMQHQDVSRQNTYNMQHQDISRQNTYNMQHQDISRESSAELHSNTGIHTVAINPQTYSRKHEVRQEEEFVNGQKVYDFHHEREYQDGKLVRENRTELGPDDLGAHRTEHRDALKDLASGRTLGSVAHNSLIEQQRTADNLLKTSCITCGGVHGAATHSQGSILSSLGLPSTHGVKSGSTFRQDVNIEEHYQDGELVKGKEEKKKWLDGQLVDAKEEHYYDGPSRANISTGLTSGFKSSSALSAFSAAPLGTVHKTSTSGDCSYNPCRNKATCKDSLRGPVCVCAFGFKGTYCEEAYCPNRYCRYGGTCTIDNDQHICSCREGYSGYRCTSSHHKIRIGVSG